MAFPLVPEMDYKPQLRAMGAGSTAVAAARIVGMSTNKNLSRMVRNEAPGLACKSEKANQA
jgi:hypothetical protein